MAMAQPHPNLNAGAVDHTNNGPKGTPTAGQSTAQYGAASSSPTIMVDAVTTQAVTTQAVITQAVTTQAVTTDSVTSPMPSTQQPDTTQAPVDVTTSPDVTATTAPVVTTEAPMTTTAVPATTAAPNYYPSIEEIVGAFKSIARSEYFKTLSYDDQILVLELTSGGEVGKIAEIMDNLGYQRLFTFVYMGKIAEVMDNLGYQTTLYKPVILMPERLSLTTSTSGRTSDFGDPSGSRFTRPISNVQDTRLHSSTGSQLWNRSFWGRFFKSKANKGGSGSQSLSRSVTIKIDTPPVQRDSWMGRVNCSISLIAAAVGLGNLSHFPYLTHEHGAGTFLFPYILTTVVVGVPLFYLEACLGQLSGQGAVLGWDMAPLFKGVGLSIGLTCAVFTIYYSVLCTYPLFYFGSSFISPLPWAHCNNSWNTKECIYVTQCSEHSRVKLRNGTCVSLRTNSSVGMWNATAARHSTGLSFIFSSHEYWLEKVEGRGEEGGLVQGHLVLCLLVVWVLCFIGLVRGVISLYKMVMMIVWRCTDDDDDSVVVYR
ncbi:hypothetical protein ACOMHN_051658 [Nucella lapillus]